jgi:aromatic-L-amino-acid decarboxylase
MDHEEFRRHAHRIVDWIADYWRDLESRHLLADTPPGATRRALPAAPPENGESFERIFEDFERIIVPGITHWGHPGWFAYFPSNASPPSVLGEILASGLAAQCMSWNTSPSATELEQVTMGWLRELLGLPETFTGVIQDTASSATLVAFLTARDRAGGDAARLTAYWSEEAHSSVAKAARLAGYADHHCRVIPTDNSFAMDASVLAAVVDADVKQGLIPGIIVGTLGTTSSTACDPLRAIGDIARRTGAWFHVDAAYGGTFAILPEIRPLLEGVELADSLVTNPHKVLLTSVHCSAYFVRDTEALTRTFATNPEYLRTAQDSEVVNFRDWGIPLGRRFNALKLWFVLRSYGAEKLREMLREHLALAQDFKSWVETSDEWQVLAPVPFGLVCIRHVPANIAHDEAALTDHNAALLARVNVNGKVFLTHTVLGDRYAIRMAIGAFRTERRHVELAWQLLQESSRVR